jgi:hypothetical protein
MPIIVLGNMRISEEMCCKPKDIIHYSFQDLQRMPIQPGYRWDIEEREELYYGQDN